MRLDQGHHGKNTTPEEVDEVVRAGKPDVRQSAHEEVPPMQQDAEETISRRQFLREEDNVRPHLRRSKRTRKQTVHFKPDFGPASRWKDNNVAALASRLENEDRFKEEEFEELWNLIADQDVNDAFNHPKAFTEFNSFAAGKNKDEDSPSYFKAMTGPYEEQFREAMNKEIEGLVKRKTWDLVSKGSIGKENPKGELLLNTWAFKVKRHTDYSIRKFKARFCVRGDVQKRNLKKK